MTKNIIAIGCSHTYGTFLDSSSDLSEENIKKCYERSWAFKIQKFLPEYNTLNLSEAGSSNVRIFRVLKKYIIDNLEELNDPIIFIGLTDPSRSEVASYRLHADPDRHETGMNYFINKVGLWSKTQNPYLRKYIDIYYSVFYVEEYAQTLLNLDIVTLHFFLKYYNLEHYFINILPPGTIFDENISMKFNLPVIKFNTGAIEFCKSNGCKVGKDYKPDSYCNHLDDLGNIFLANEIFKKMQEIKHEK